MGFSSSAHNGRTVAHQTNTTRRMTTIATIERTTVPIAYANRTVDTNAWVVYGTCGHELSRLVTEAPSLPGRLALTFPIGKRKRCPHC